MNELNEFYGLTHNPFDKNAQKTKDAFDFEDHREMIQRLELLKTCGAVGVFTAAPGMGKTFALRRFMEGLNSNLNESAYVPLTTVPVTEFYGQICDTLGLERSARRSIMFRTIRDHIYNLFREKHRPLILAIDEAQHLDPRILVDLKMLLNYGYDSMNCFSLVLLGEPQLYVTLQKPAYEALRQRISVSYCFRGMSEEETTRYLAHKLQTAGGTMDILAPAAISTIRTIAQGCPRKVDILMTHALTHGARTGTLPIDNRLISAAADGNIALK